MYMARHRSYSEYTLIHPSGFRSGVWIVRGGDIENVALNLAPSEWRRDIVVELDRVLSVVSFSRSCASV